MDLNRAMIIGNMTRDPEVRTTPAGQKVASFSLATNRVWNDAAGGKQTAVEYHNIVAWRRLADIAEQYLKKGRKVYVEGHLQTRDWTGQDGAKRNRTEIVADNLILLDRPPAGSYGGGYAAQSAGGPATSASQQPAAEPVIQYDEPAAPAAPANKDEEIKVEDIPF